MKKSLVLVVVVLSSLFIAFSASAEDEETTGEAQAEVPAEEPKAEPVPMAPAALKAPDAYQPPSEGGGIGTMAPPVAEEPAPGETFKSASTLGGIFAFGNTNTISAILDSKNTLYVDQFDFMLNLFGIYGSTKYPGGKWTESMRLYGASLKGLWYWSEVRTNYLFLQTGFLSDIYKGYDWRAFVEGGYGRSWFGKRTDANLRTELGVNYTHDDFTQVDAEGRMKRDSISGLLFIGFEYAFSEALSLGEDFRMLVNLISPNDMRIESNTYIVARLNSIFALSTGLALKYNNNPAMVNKIDDQGNQVMFNDAPVLIPAEKLDIILSVALVISFGG